MRDLQPGLTEQAKKTVGFTESKEEAERERENGDVRRLSHFFRPGQLRAILLTPWS